MQLLVLGSGGNAPIPMPTCSCGICREARERGVPYARHGNSMYLRELSAMIDAPEQTFTNLAREGIADLEYVFLTHWHPDHVCGVRVIQARDYTEFDPDERSWIEHYTRETPTVVTTRKVYERSCELTGLDHWVDRLGIADVHYLDEEPLRDSGIEVRALPYSLSGNDEGDATGFLFDDGSATIAVVSDDARHFDVDQLPPDLDLAVFECGIFERGPDGERVLTDADLDVLAHELRHHEVLDRVRGVDPDRTILTEIGHLNARGYDSYRELESREAYDGVQFAHDGLEVEVQ